MAAKKKPLTSLQIAKALKFRIEWIKDPVPPFRKHLDAAALKRIEKAKVAFGKEINAIVKKSLA